MLDLSAAATRLAGEKEVKIPKEDILRLYGHKRQISRKFYKEFSDECSKLIDPKRVLFVQGEGSISFFVIPQNYAHSWGTLDQFSSNQRPR